MLSTNKQLEKDYDELSEKINFLQEFSQVAYWSREIDGDEMLLSKEFTKIFELDQNSLHLSLEEFYSFVHSEDLKKVRLFYDKASIEKKDAIEYRILVKSGREKIIKEKRQIIFNQEKEPVTIFTVIKDITENQAQHLAKIGSWEMNLLTKRIVLSHQAKKIFNFPDQKDYKLELFEKIIHESDIKQFKDIIKKASKDPVEIKFRVIEEDGSIRYLSGMIEFIFDEKEQALSMNGTIQNISESEKNKKEIENLNYFDQLTGLPNNKNFRKKVDEMSLCAKNEKDSFALFILDIGSFLKIKNYLGNEVAEKYIKEVGERLKDTFQEKHFIGKYFDDRFVILVNGKNNLNVYEKLIKDIYQLFYDSVTVYDYELEVSINIGISFYSRADNGKPLIIRKAEKALFLAKSEGKNDYEYYSEDLSIQSYKHFVLRKDLKKSIANNQLAIHYQPIVTIGSNNIFAVEALVRWEHPEWGIISPIEFINIAEETGFIIKIGDWLIREICEKYKKWTEENVPNIKININYSIAQLLEKDFVSKIKNVFEEFQLDPSILVIEVKENFLIIDSKKIKSDFKELQSLGVSIAIDDFGSYYSSLLFLHNFNIDIIKIDGSFIKNINKNKKSNLIINSIIKISRELNVKVIAEHVEDHNQLYFLKELKCDFAQGFLFSHPVPYQEFERILREKRCHPIVISSQYSREERRKYFRVKFSQLLEADISILEIKGKKVNVGNTKVLVKNMGPGGLCFISNIKFPVSGENLLKFNSELTGEEIEMKGYIVWFKEFEANLFEYGLEFMMDEKKRTDLIKKLNVVQLGMRNDPLYSEGRFYKRSMFYFFNKIN